jgi:hypothetical protein
VIKPLSHNPARALLDFADVNQHPGSRIDGTGENEIGGVIATASVARFRFGTKDGQIFVVAPFGNMQATRSRKFESLADGQKHESANTPRPIAQGGSTCLQDDANPVAKGASPGARTASRAQKLGGKPDVFLPTRCP